MCVCLRAQCVRLLASLWTIIPPNIGISVGFSRQEYLRELPFPPPGDLLYPGIKPGFPALLDDSLPSEPPGKPLAGDLEAGISHQQEFYIRRA